MIHQDIIVWWRSPSTMIFYSRLPSRLQEQVCLLYFSEGSNIMYVSVMRVTHNKSSAHANYISTLSLTMSSIPLDARKIENSSFVAELQPKLGKIYQGLIQINCILPSLSQIIQVLSKPNFSVIKSSNLM